MYFQNAFFFLTRSELGETRFDAEMSVQDTFYCGQNAFKIFLNAVWSILKDQEHLENIEYKY